MSTSTNDDRVNRPLVVIFAFLFLQLQLLVFCSLCSSKGIVFVREHSSGFDLRDFIAAAVDWHQGFNPYDRARFVTPPPTVIIGAAFTHMTFTNATRWFFLMNLCCLFGSAGIMCRHYRMSAINTGMTLAIASLFYPSYFLLERGNLDGIMLALICAAITVKNRLLRGVFIDISVVLKVYTVLFLGLLLLAKHFRTLALTMLTIFLILLPFHGLVSSYMTAALTRSSQFTAVENLSPAVILGALAKTSAGKLLYILLWTLSMLRASWRHRDLDLGKLCISSATSS